MVELRTKMTESGVLYVPKEVREAFGRELVIVPNSCAVVMFRQGVKYEHVLSSLKIIAADLRHRIVLDSEKEGDLEHGR
jgi:bifunctional DNA-binding transcriptional regulator/antitoxin component of YhaV-PrlF toxin-antitoxin module